MIVLQKLNVVREVSSEAEATKLESQGFKRRSGQAENSSAAGSATEKDFARMSEAMFERLQKNLHETLKEATAVPAVALPEPDEKKDDTAPSDKEEKDGRKAAGKDNGNSKK